MLWSRANIQKNIGQYTTKAIFKNGENRDLMYYYFIDTRKRWIFESLPNDQEVPFHSYFSSRPYSTIYI